MRGIRFHPQAQIEMVASAKYYEAEQEGLGKRFLDAVNATTRRASLFPSTFQRLEGNLHRCCVDRFPFGVVFREGADEIQVIAVIHFKRDPDHWKTRI
jgi:plasmid stabilization system protein ParE